MQMYSMDHSFLHPLVVFTVHWQKSFLTKYFPSYFLNILLFKIYCMQKHNHVKWQTWCTFDLMQIYLNITMTCDEDYNCMTFSELTATYRLLLQHYLYNLNIKYHTTEIKHIWDTKQSCQCNTSAIQIHCDAIQKRRRLRKIQKTKISRRLWFVQVVTSKQKFYAL